VKIIDLKKINPSIRSEKRYAPSYGLRPDFIQETLRYQLALIMT